MPSTTSKAGRSAIATAETAKPWETTARPRPIPRERSTPWTTTAPASWSTARGADALRRQGLIRPTTTQGHIGDVTRTDIVFDAATTQGGSGGPVFNKQGEVIAVEYALLTKFGGNSFAIPIAYALELLSASS